MNPYDAPAPKTAPAVAPVPTCQAVQRLLLTALLVANSAVLLVEMPHPDPLLVGFNLGAALATAAWFQRSS